MQVEGIHIFAMPFDGGNFRRFRIAYISSKAASYEGICRDYYSIPIEDELSDDG
jgi:hypothetical protein